MFYLGGLQPPFLFILITMKFNFLLQTFAFLSSSLFFAQQQYPIDPKVKQRIDSVYTSLVKKNKVVGASLAIVDKNGIIYANGYGFSDLENQVKADEKTVYRIGSVSKVLTNLGVLRLENQRLLYLDDDIKTHLTDLKMESRFENSNLFPITELMSHTAGFPSDIANGFFCDNPPSMTWVIEQLNRSGATYPRNFVWSYSNVAYGLLGELISRKSGLSYSQFMRDSLFNVLGMKNSFVHPVESDRALMAKGYIKKNQLIDEPLIRDEAAGLVHSNVTDFAKIIQLFLNEGNHDGKQIIDSNSIRLLQIPGYLTDLYLQPSFNYGLGLFIEETFLKNPTDTIPINYISHGGDTYAFHADFGFVPELGLGVVVLTNSDKGRSVNSAKNLLNYYLDWNQKSKILEVTEVIKDLAEKRLSYGLVESSRIPGAYNCGAFVLEMNSAKKGSFRQGPIKIVIKPKKNEEARFNLHVKLLGLFSIKLPNQEIQFVEVEDKVYVRGASVKDAQWQHLGVKKIAPEISSTWLSKMGTYKTVGDTFPCKACDEIDMNFSEVTLSQKGRYIIVSARGSKKGSIIKLFFEQLDEKTLVCGGTGRGMGETIQLLPDGKLFYQGFDLEKIK